MVSLLDGCSEGCGWAAAILAALSWGTFGVPIKCNVNVEVNFFVMQSYKTIVCFATCWLVLLLGEPIRWSYWGIVSGLFWVPGASCGIYAIRNCGVAVAVGTWASIQVISSCIFGIIIFQEKVKNVPQTMLAFCILMSGLIGMSRYSDSSTSSSTENDQYQSVPLNDNTTSSTTNSTLSASSSTHMDDSSSNILSSASPKLRKASKVNNNNTIDDHNNPSSSLSESSGIAPAPATAPVRLTPLEMEDGILGGGTTGDITVPLLSQSDHYNDTNPNKERLFFFFNGRVVLTRRQMGIAGAVVNGAWGGLNLIPLHYAQRDQGLSGAGYLISYATGSLLVCASIWVGLFLYHYMKKEYNVQDAIACLPAWHVQELGLPGLYAGLFYSLGNFCSILAVAYLGQGVGFSFCQGQLLISGLWGVFYFKEIQGKETIMKWFGSAIVTVIGIIMLSYQHEGGASHR